MYLTSVNSIIKLFAHTILSSVGAFYLALLFRFEFQLRDQVPYSTIVSGLLLLLFSRLAAYLYFRVYNAYWRYFSLRDLPVILRAHFFSSVLFTALVLLFRLEEFPRSIVFIEFILSLLANMSVVVSWRLLMESRSRGVARSSKEMRRALIVGAGDMGQFLAKSMLHSPGSIYQPIGYLDDKKQLLHGRIHALPVLGDLSSLAHVLVEQSVDVVLLAIPTLSSAKYSDIKKVCDHSKVLVHKLHSFEDVILDSVSSYSQEEPHWEALLDRQFSKESDIKVVQGYSDQSILITGAGGSIGSEIVNQLVAVTPNRLILYDNSEYNLFKLQCSLARYSESIEIIYALGDIRDIERLQGVFASYKPDVVFHAAAYKHVPLGEENPYEIFKTNVQGTKNVIDMSLSHEVSRFILISTDKAVDPVSVMGASKRVAELLLRTHSRDGHQTVFSAVRFGNVVNSTGSVIPLFREQILLGGPVTVTHPDVERYFMSTNEAVKLTLVAGTLDSKGDIFVLNMGEKVRVLDLAQRMIELYGRNDVRIDFVGLRPGEKLTEELIIEGDDLVHTEMDKIFRLETGQDYQFGVIQEIEEIGSRLSSLSEEQIKEAVVRLAFFQDEGSLEVHTQ